MHVPNNHVLHYMISDACVPNIHVLCYRVSDACAKQSCEETDL